MPAPTSGATRPETRYAYVAQQAYYKNSTGSIVASGQPITLLASTSACQNAASCAGGADETKSTFAYGPQSSGTSNNLLPVSTTAGSGNGSLAATVSFTYDNIGNSLTIDGPLPGNVDVTRTRYDGRRRVIGVVGPDPDGGAYALKHKAVRYNYNNEELLASVQLGTVNSQSDPDWAAINVLQTSTPSYDANRRKTKDVISAGGTDYGVVQYGYDAAGRPECTALRMNSSTWGSLPSSACSQGIGGSYGPDRISRTVYNAANEVVIQQKGYGTPLQANDSTYTYSTNGQVTTIADAKNNFTTYEYDGQDRLVKTRYPSPTAAGSSSTTDYVQSTYDPNGNVTNQRLRDGQTVAFAYDNINRLTFKDLPGAEPDVTYGYDLLDRLTSASSQTGNALSFTYDALSRNLTQTGPLGTVTSTWDVAGRRTRLDLPGGFWTTYDYYTTGAMWAIREWGSAGGVGVNYIGYDDLGRRANIQRGNGTVTYYDYDAVSRLSQLNQAFPAASSANHLVGYSYNPASQITSRWATNDAYAMRQQYNASRTYTSNGLNQYMIAGSVNLTYDGRGNLTAQGGSSYSYNAENMMTHATQSGSATTLSYDPAMRLYQVGDTRFLYDGTDLVAEYDGSGNLQRRYVHGPAADEVMTWYEGGDASQRRWLHTDERGSVIAVSDVNGALLQANAYDEWGNPQSSNIGRFGYTGQTWLPEVGLWYYKARMYSPRLGRFMQTDPIGYGDGMNLYAYVGDDPVNKFDFGGTKKEIVTGSLIKQEGGGLCGSCSGFSTGGTSEYKWTRTTTYPDGSTSSFVSYFSLPSLDGTGGMGLNFSPGVGFANQSLDGEPQSDEEAEPVQEARLGAVLKFAKWLATKLAPKVVTPVAKFPTNPGQLRHIFRNAPGHYGVDSPAARAEINRALGSFSHTDRFGNSIYSSINPGGSQTWVQVRNGIIQNAGVNASPVNIISRFP